MGLFTSTKSDKAKFKKLKKEEGCVVSLSIEIPAEEVTNQTQTSLVRLQNRARIPGFRAGKAFRSTSSSSTSPATRRKRRSTR